MYENNEKNIIIEMVQSYMTGKLDPSTNFNPQFLADSIIQKINFSKPLTESGWQRLNEVRLKLDKGIQALEDEMKEKLNFLQSDEKLLANFIRGKLTAYSEILDLLKKL